ELTATGSDANGDTLTYSWEQRDLGVAQNLVTADNGTSPIFRVWNPTTNPTRTFPRLSNLLNNTLPVGEKYPAVARAQMKFRVTARDNRSGGGAVNWADTFVQVVNTGAPFLVTSPNTAVTWNSGTTQTVTWNVAGTDSGLVNTPNVNVKLSTDGGLTFPITLASNVPNDGSQDVTVPALNTSLARIRVEGAGNIFFDLSNVNFTISNVDVTPPTVDIVDVTPDPRNTSVSSIAINFSEPVTGFGLGDLTLTRNGSPVSLAGASLAGGPQNHTLNGLSGLTNVEGTYVLTLNAAGSGIVDGAGNPLASNASDTWVTDLTAPTLDIVDVTPDPRNTSVSSIVFAFSEPVTGFGLGDFGLSRNGVPISLAGASISGGPQNYSLDGLTSITNIEGAYFLLFNAGSSGVPDLAGNPITLNALESWSLDLTAPTVDIVDVTPDPRNTPVGSITIVFSEAVTGFDLGDLALTRNGGPNLLTGAQTLTTADNVTFTLNNLTGLTTPGGNYVLTLTAPGGIADLSGNPLATGASDHFLVQTTLVVTSVMTTPGGVVVTFNKPINPISLNMYDNSVGALGPADLTFVGFIDGPVRGSLIVAPDNLSVTFVKTGGLLTAQNYLVTLRSAANGFKDASGGLLDGNADGTPGDNFSAAYNPPGSLGSRFIFFPDFSRGSGQPVDVPATSTGLPVSISDGTGVTSVSLRINYNPAYLVLNSVTPGPDAPGGAVVNLDTSTPGFALLTYSGPALPSGVARFASLNAMVPTSTLYGLKQVLTFTNLSVNAGAITTIADPAVHVVGYFGDATGNGAISGLDASLANRVSASLDSGFVAFQLADPVILADINGSGNISGLDATLINRFAASIPTPQIPPIPALPPVIQSGLDPKISLPTGLAVRAGGALSVPVRVENTDVVPVGIEAFDLVVSLGRGAFRVRSVSAAGYDLTWSFDGETGLLTITAARPDGPVTMVPGESGVLARIELVALPDARPGSHSLNLLESVYANGADRRTSLNEGRLVLIPAPTNAADDPNDGQVRITRLRARETTPSALGAAAVWVIPPRTESPFSDRPLFTLSRRGKNSRDRGASR
ncbi:MAG: hypothetical protein AB7I30_01165, partial [Isosphaeraceae bacterium]